MAQEGFDELMALTESRYRLSMITARRAAQLKAGVPPLLDPENYPKTRNTVSLAMKELEEGVGVVWGDDLPSADELRGLLERDKREEERSYSVSRSPVNSDDEDEDE